MTRVATTFDVPSTSRAWASRCRARVLVALASRWSPGRRRPSHPVGDVLAPHEIDGKRTLHGSKSLQRGNVPFPGTEVLGTLVPRTSGPFEETQQPLLRLWHLDQRRRPQAVRCLVVPMNSKLNSDPRARERMAARAHVSGEPLTPSRDIEIGRRRARDSPGK